MKTEEEYLLTCVAEECAEIIQRVTKIDRFGIEEVQEGQELNNIERFVGEVNDLYAVLEMLEPYLIDRQCVLGSRKALEAKIERVEKYMELSRKQGKLR